MASDVFDLDLETIYLPMSKNRTSLRPPMLMSSHKHFAKHREIHRSILLHNPYSNILLRLVRSSSADKGYWGVPFVMLRRLLGLLFEFSRKGGVEENREKSRNQVWLFDNKDYRLDKTLETRVVTFVGEDVVEPSRNTEGG
jgi:hypothetical protein